jgi:endonuclease YncB( thermonuclease family)
MKRFVLGFFALIITSLVFAQPMQIPDSSVYTVIHGAFVLEGYKPDGDSLRFIADNTSDWSLLENAKSIDSEYLNSVQNQNETNIDQKNSVQTRFEALDTPEFGDGLKRQPLGRAARDFTLKYLGYGKIEFTPQGKQVRSASPNRTRAVLLSRSAPSGTQGRPVVYVFRESDWVFGQSKQIIVQAQWLEKSLNFALLASGLAYPEFYLSLPVAHRGVFQKAVQKARASGLGIGTADKSDFFKAGQLEQITEAGVQIFPKLYRRLEKYFEAREDNKTNLDFYEFLRQGKAENDRLIYDGKRYKLTDFLIQKGNEFWFKANLNEIVFEQ